MPAAGVATPATPAAAKSALHLSAAGEGRILPQSVSAVIREALAAFSAATGKADAGGSMRLVYRYDLSAPAFRTLFRSAVPATPTAAGAAAGAATVWHRQQQTYDSLGSPFYVLLLQAIYAAAEGGPSAAAGSDTLSAKSDSLETAAAEVAAMWQLQVAKDLRTLRWSAEALQAAGEVCWKSLPTPGGDVVAPPSCMQQEELEAAAVALLCNAAEAVSLLAALQLKLSVRDAVPTLLLVLERVCLSRELSQVQAQHKQQQEEVLQAAQSAAFSVALPSLAASPLSGAADATAATAAEAAIRCLHALGRCHLFSEELLRVVSAHHLAAAAPDAFALYLFECGRMGLRCKRYIDACIEKATKTADAMSPPSLLLACAGLYRFCTDWRMFYRRATPRLLKLLDTMDYYQLRLMLRVAKHLNPSFKDSELTLLSRGAARLLCAQVPSLAPQQLCCIASFVEQRCSDTPEEYSTLTQSLVAALEATASPASARPLSSSNPQESSASVGKGGTDSLDPLALVHPLHDLVDVVDCIASYGSQSSLVPRIESVLASRYTEIEYSVNFTLWLVCLDAFSRVRGFYPRQLLQHISASLCNPLDVCSTGRSGSSSSKPLEAPSLLDSLSVLQRLKFMQALTRLSFFPLSIVQMWCISTKGEASLFRSLRDTVTCVFPLALMVYIHPKLFSRAFGYVESRYNGRRQRPVLLATDAHLEPFYLSHLCWAFIVAEMHSRPFFLSLLDRSLELLPLPEGVLCSAHTSDSFAKETSERDFQGALPCGLGDFAAAGAEAENPAVRAAGASAAAEKLAGGHELRLTPLDRIAYRNHCEPVALLQQVCQLLQLEAPQLAAAARQQDALKAYAGAVVRWKADRRGDIRQFCEEVRETASKASLEWREALEGTPPSPVPAFGHQWPFSEVSLWVKETPLVLMAEDEGLRLTAKAEGKQRNYNTGHKYLLLRAFRALGISKVATMDSEEWCAAQSLEQRVALLQKKLLS
ncbi:uncharacterized protein LOC34619194 [Cyclospora cayetanensis]|uniref:Uncharacterized protein LOC34619194 n=1 Tax=Cyclospora cayetanensis TaxID=88456 RepID=A0A6P6RUF6_9EIME|nr:uncharacterized protein LOC34619194 [Cyclospora cayetanensis]